MSLHRFFLEDSKRRICDAVAEAEASTSAEIVVTVRRASGDYRHADYLGGAVASLALLCVFLYWPEPFDYTYFPLEQIGAFVLGAYGTRAAHPLRRFLAGRRALERNVRTAARAAFMEVGAGKTRERNGVLVYVSAFEREVFVVPDVGVDEKPLGVVWSDALKHLDRAVSRDADPDRFAAAIKDLGAALAKVFPRRADDVNELVDQVDEDEEDDDDDEDEDDDDIAEERAS